MWHPQSDYGMPGKGFGLDPRSQCSPTFFTSRHLWTMVLFVLGAGVAGRAALRPRVGHGDLMQDLAGRVLGGWLVGYKAPHRKEVTRESGLARGEPVPGSSQWNARRKWITRQRLTCSALSSPSGYLHHFP